MFSAKKPNEEIEDSIQLITDEKDDVKLKQGTIGKIEETPQGKLNAESQQSQINEKDPYPAWRSPLSTKQAKNSTSSSSITVDNTPQKNSTLTKSNSSDENCSKYAKPSSAVISGHLTAIQVEFDILVDERDKLKQENMLLQERLSDLQLAYGELLKNSQTQTTTEVKQQSSPHSTATKSEVGSSSMFFSQPTLPVSSTSEIYSSSISSIPEHSVQELQDVLTLACYQADLKQVKMLVEQKGVSPIANDSQRQTATTAAIRGLAFNVLEYLETKTNYELTDWLDMARKVQNKDGTLILFNRSVTTFQNLVKHYEKNKDSFIYDHSELEKRRVVAIKSPYKNRKNLKSFEEPLLKSRTVAKAFNRPAIRGKRAALLEIHTPIKGKVKDKIVNYEWEGTKQLNRITFGKEKGSVFLLWELADMMKVYLYNKGIKLNEQCILQTQHPTSNTPSSAMQPS